MRVVALTTSVFPTALHADPHRDASSEADEPELAVGSLFPQHPIIVALSRIDEACFGPAQRTDIANQLTQPFTKAWAACVELITDPADHGLLTPSIMTPPGQRLCWIGFVVTWHVADELHVINVATHPSFRRRGVGAALIDEVIAYARQRDVRLVLLEVRRGNSAAIGLYRRYGFEQTGVRERYYSDNDEDALEMMLTLGADPGSVVRRDGFGND